MEILLESTSNKLMVGIRQVSHMLEILSRRFFLKLNLSDHKSILTDLQETLKRRWRLRTLEANLSEFIQTNQFAGAVSAIHEIVQRYMDRRMNEEVKVAVQIQSDRLIIQNLPHFGSLFCFDNRLRTLEANLSEFIQTNQFAGAVSAIYGIVQRYMDRRMNEEVKVAVQIQSDHLRDEAQRENDEFLKTTSYAVAADLSEMELKKILIEKMEGNKSIQISDEQRNLYKALVEAYESDKIILDTYRETVTLKRQQDDDADKDKEPSVGPDWGSTQGSQSRQASASESAFVEEHVQTTCQMEDPSHLEFDTCAEDQLIVNPKGQQYPHNLLKPLPLIPNNRGHHVIPFEHFINNDLEYLRGGASSRKYTTSITKTKTADYGHIKWIEDLFYGFAINWESARDVYSKRRIIAVTELKIVEWHNYKHLDWITVQRDDDKLYKFKEGDFIRLRIQDIEDMLLLLIQGKLTNLTVEERFAFNVSLRMFTRCILFQRHVEDLQLGVESYQKKLNLTKPDSYRYDLKRKKAYTAYSNPRGFIYQNKDKKNRLMQIDELYKFSDGMRTDKIEGKKSIQRSDEQRNLYKALVEAYESNKIILDTYEETVTLKRCRDGDADKDEEPSAGPDRGSAGRLTQGTKSRQVSASESATAEEPMQTTFQIEEPSHLEFDTSGLTYDLLKGPYKILVELEYHLEEVYKATTNQLDWVNIEGQQYPHNLLKPLPLIPNNRGHRVIPFDHFINNDLEYLCGGASSCKYTTFVTKTKAADYGHIKWIEDLGRKRPQFNGFAVNQESARDVYSKRRIIAVTDLKIVEWHNYKHLDLITIRIDDDKLYKFKEGDFKRLCIQDIEYIDGTLTDVRTALDDRLKGIRMQYLPQSIWRKSDKDRAVAMI
nr:hypothetical protein [Tanacetum cinerariifolium]